MAVLVINMISSCKSDDSKPSNSTIAPLEANLDKLPVACDIIDEKTMLDILGIDATSLDISDGNKSGGSSSNTASCFYKWNDKVYDASGVLILVQRNPLPDELPDFVQATLNNKKYEGENSMNPNDPPKKYKDFEGLGFQAVYNEELGRYYFAKDVKYLYSIAFNYPVGQDKLNEYFKALSTAIMAKM